MRSFSFHWIRAIYFRGSKYLPRPKVEELGAAEKEIGVRLPASYRAFAQRFGLGGRLHTLPELFPLTPLPGPQPAHWWASITNATEFHRSAEAADTAPADFLQRAVIFGIDEGQHTFAFHAGEVTDPVLAEYRIYDIPRHGNPEPIADSFENWLKWIREGYRLDHDSSEEERNKERLGLEFDPDSMADNPMPYWRTAL